MTPNNLSAEQMGTIQSWDFSQVRSRLQYKEGMSEQEALILEAEYKKYLALLFSCPGEQFPVPEDVDRFGHVHALFTKDSDALVRQVLGSGRIHHQPTVSDEESAALRPLYQATTLPVLTAMFGQLNELIWKPDCVCCWHCER